MRDKFETARYGMLMSELAHWNRNGKANLSQIVILITQFGRAADTLNWTRTMEWNVILPISGADKVMRSMRSSRMRISRRCAPDQQVTMVQFPGSFFHHGGRSCNKIIIMITLI